jgi:hypothetical protein
MDSVRATEAADLRFQAQLAEAVAELNAKIARYNLLVRAQLLQLTPLTPDLVRQLAAREE